ncbi:odorant receptor 4-like [Armigeres subalbatus]|uniref:odorant receptor 4-like n=1 Tax=Armigeres subalbatus TaxID=124917 RepID=UPI002ED20823
MSSDQATEPEVLHVGLGMLTFIGLHGSNGSRIWRYFFAVGWLLGNIILPKAILGSGQEGFDSVARSLAEMIFFSDACLAVSIFVTRRKPFEQMVRVLQEIFARYEAGECLDEVRGFNLRMKKFATGYVTYIKFLVVLFLGVPIVWTLCVEIFLSEDERHEYMLVVEVEYFYLDIRRNLIHYLIYFAFCAPAVIVSAYQSCIKATVFLTSLQYGGKLFELIKIRIQGLEAVEPGAKRRDELRKIVQLHEMSLRYTQLLEETMSFILISQMMNCMAIWCLMMVYLSTNYGPNAGNVVVLFIVLIGEMFVYCSNGTRLSENALEVSNAIYNHKWYNEPVGMQRDMRFMIQRAQKPTGVTAAKFYFVNNERLGIIIQASYSYYLLLKSLF